MRARTLLLAAVVALPLSACADRELPTTPTTDALAPSLQLSSQDETGVVVTGRFTQVTDEAYSEFQPRIDGDIVVFTVSTEGGQNVAYVDLASGDRRQITSGSGNQRLQDVSGRRIVYADYSTRFAEVMIYDIDTETTTAVPSEEGTRDQPAIKGDRVAYMQSVSGIRNIMVADLAAGLTTAVTSDDLWVDRPSIDRDFVAFERWSMDGIRFVVLHDLRDGTEKTLMPDALDQRRPHVDGDRVVFDAFVEGRTVRDLVIYQISTGSLHHIAAEGNQSYARLSGDWVAFDDDWTGSDVVLMHLPTGFTHRITSPSTYDYFSDIDGNRVVFTSNAAGGGKLDIWLYEFDFTLPGEVEFPAVGERLEECGWTEPPVLPDPFFLRTITRQTGKPQTETHYFDGSGPALVVVDNHECGAAWTMLNGEPLFTADEMDPEYMCLWGAVALEGDNTIQLSAQGKPGCSVTVGVYPMPQH